MATENKINGKKKGRTKLLTLFYVLTIERIMRIIHVVLLTVYIV